MLNQKITVITRDGICLRFSVVTEHLMNTVASEGNAVKAGWYYDNDLDCHYLERLAK